MEDFKRKFIDFCFANGLQVFDDPEKDRTLKSKRISPWFFNAADFNDGNTLGRLSEAYADAIISSGVEIDSIYGIPEKGVGLVGPVASALAKKGKNVGWFFTRKMPKEHGEGTGKKDLSKLVVGRMPKDGQRICNLDDVFTTGEAKYDALKDLQSMGNFEVPLIAITMDRMEVGINGISAIEEYERETGAKVVSGFNAIDVLEYLNEHLKTNGAIHKASGEVFMDSNKLEISVRRLSNYLRVYGTNAVREHVSKLEQSVINRNRSVIPACDVTDIDRFEELVKQTADLDGIGGYKLGFTLGLKYGLPKVAEVARKYTDKPLIYDHQKAGTDIPDTGKDFAKVTKESGIDTVILFPQAGPETERAWIYHALDNGLNVIVGGRMTHPAYSVSEGGFITDEGALEIYRIAARSGVNNFVVPGNKPDVIKQVRELVEAEGINPVFYAPGFIAQGGSISDAAKVAGERFHGIVGRGIYTVKEMRAAAIEYTSQLS